MVKPLRKKQIDTGAMKAPTLDALALLSATATQGEWCVENPMDFEWTIVLAGLKTYEWEFIANTSWGESADERTRITKREAKANADFIVAAVNTVRRLLSTEAGRTMLEGERS